MTTKHYVIRRKYFSYQDQCYSLTDFQLGEIVAVFEDQEQAEEKLKALHVAYLHDNTLSEYNVHSLLSPEQLSTINQTFITRCGEAVMGDYGHLVDVVPASFSDEDTVYLAESLGILAYQLEVLTDENYVIWLSAQEDYLRLPNPYDNPFSPDDDYVGALIYGQDIDFIQKSPQAKQQLLSQVFAESTTRYGTLEQLSTAPQQLTTVLERYPNDWQFEHDCLKSKKPASRCDDAALMAINGLLKQPFFEVHCLNFLQLKALIDQETIEEVR